MSQVLSAGAFLAGASALLFRVRTLNSRRSLYTVKDVRAVKPAIVLSGKVINGFGRGGKLLHCPTANMDIDPKRVDEMETGIYCGWAKLEGDASVYQMVASIGWNPTFNNSSKTVEPHLLHEFAEDFYGKTLSIVICGYMRPELKFDSMESLIDAIENDKKVGRETLSSGVYDSAKNLFAP